MSPGWAIVLRYSDVGYKPAARASHYLTAR